MSYATLWHFLGPVLIGVALTLWLLATMWADRTQARSFRRRRAQRRQERVEPVSHMVPSPRQPQPSEQGERSLQRQPLQRQ